MDTRRFKDPKSHVRFLQAVRVEGAPHKEGEVVERSAIHAGHLEALLRMRHVEECDDPNPPPEPKQDRLAALIEGRKIEPKAETKPPDKGKQKPKPALPEDKELSHGV